MAVEITNSPVKLDTITEPARKRVTRAQRWGAATLCVPVSVEIRGGSYVPVTNNDNLQPWDRAGEFRFSLFEDRGRGSIAEQIVRYNLTGDGRMRRLIAVEVGGEIKFDDKNHIIPNIEWYEGVVVRGVDAKVTQQDGIEGDILSFVAVPEPVQWSSSERFRTFRNSQDEPIPFLESLDIVF